MPPKARSQSKVSASQASQPSSQARKSGTSQTVTSHNFSHDEIERMTNALVKFLLVMDQKKLPIKKAEMTKYVFKDKEASKIFPDLMKKAATKLSQVFGLSLEELSDKKSYILINKLSQDSEASHLEWPEEDSSKMGLVTFILSLIFMSGNVIQDGQLWHALKRVGLHQDKHHEVFGDVKKMIFSELVKQGYLEVTKLPSEQPVSEIRWGYRAKLETTKRNILHFVCQVYPNEVTPEQWTSQWQDIIEDENQASS